jgi:hypothetical protein
VHVHRATEASGLESTWVLGNGWARCWRPRDPAHRGGDSGSPVFRGTSNVTLLGILWGGSGSQFVYSPIANIEQELGALTTR